MIVVHVDDMVIVGSDVARAETIKELRAEYDMKHEHGVSEPGHQARLLGRTLIKTQRGYTLVNDGAHVQKLQEIFDLKSSSKGALTPGDKDLLRRVTCHRRTWLSFPLTEHQCFAVPLAN
mmetsp:Transcript_32821/g.75074  ORF Transcript_32821/g.75074 Transcript_32821/m.75074 type:complete len:120 (+) Transcript_32821:357-716(+)